MPKRKLRDLQDKNSEGCCRLPVGAVVPRAGGRSTDLLLDPWPNVGRRSFTALGCVESPDINPGTAKTPPRAGALDPVVMTSGPLIVWMQQVRAETLSLFF